MKTEKQSDFLEVGVATAGRGDLEAVRAALSLHPEWLRRRGSHGRTMLWEAAYRGKQDVVQFLAERGAELNAHGCHYALHRVEISPYCVARWARREAVAEWLARHGAVMDLFAAAFLGDESAVCAFLDSDPDLVHRHVSQHDPEWGPRGRGPIDPASSNYAMPLCYAICGGHPNVAAHLIARGAEVRPHSWHLLRYAGGNVAILRLLLESGADPHEAPRPISADDDLGRLLQRYGVEPAVDGEPGRGWPPLVYACRGDRGEHPERIQHLLQAGADVNLPNYQGLTALHVAARAGFTRAMAVLLDHGATIDARDPAEETPLFAAVRAQRVAAAALLLASGADAWSRNKSGMTALDVAGRARRAGAATMKELLQRHASPREETAPTTGRAQAGSDSFLSAHRNSSTRRERS